MPKPIDVATWLRDESRRWAAEAKTCRAADGSWRFVIDAIDCDAYATWFGRVADEVERLRTELGRSEARRDELEAWADSVRRGLGVPNDEEAERA